MNVVFLTRKDALMTRPRNGLGTHLSDAITTSSTVSKLFLSISDLNLFESTCSFWCLETLRKSTLALLNRIRCDQLHSRQRQNLIDGCFYISSVVILVTPNTPNSMLLARYFLLFRPLASASYVTSRCSEYKYCLLISNISFKIQNS